MSDEEQRPPPPPVADVDRDQRIASVEAMVAAAAAEAVSAPPPQALPVTLYTVFQWYGYDALRCKLCPFDRIIYADRSHKQASEDLYIHYLRAHLDIKPDDEEEE